MESLAERINRWEKMSETLKELRALEMDLRTNICCEIINGDAEKELTIKQRKELDLLDGRVVEANANTTEKIDEDIWGNILPDLDEDEKAVVVYKPSLSKTNLKKVAEDSSVYEAIFEVPAAPTLKIKAKKRRK